MQRIYWDALNINGQKVFYTVTSQGLNFVSSPKVGVSQILDFYPLTQFEYVHSHHETDRYRKALKKYLKGKAETFAFNFDYFVDGTPQQEEVWQRIMQIPYGKTLTLAALAQQLHQTSQAVAQAMKACPIWLAVPLHRVTDLNHETGFRTDEQMSEYLRALEQKPRTELKELIKKA